MGGDQPGVRGVPLFEETVEGLAPAPHARSPWSPDMLHGRFLAGLMARAIDRDHGDPRLPMVRLTVDMFRPAPMMPMAVTTTVIRDGNRVRSVDAAMHSGGVLIARASSMMLARSEQRKAAVWATQPWSSPADPESLPVSTLGRVPFDARTFGPGGPIGGPSSPLDGPRRGWMQEAHPLLAGEVASPLVRLAMTADFASPLVNSGDPTHRFINADLTLYIHRLPQGPWIGLEATGHLDAEGIAIGHATMFDADGPLAFASVCGVADTRRDD